MLRSKVILPLTLLAVTLWWVLGEAPMPISDEVGNSFLWGCALQWFPQQWGQRLVGYLLLLAAAAVMLHLNRHHSLLRQQGPTAVALFLLLTLVAQTATVHVGSIVALCIMGAFDQLFAAHRQRSPIGEYFRLFLFLSVAVVLFPPVLYVVPFFVGCVIQLRLFDGRTVCAILFGAALPFWFLFLYALFVADFSCFPRLFAPLNALPFSGFAWSSREIVAAALTLALWGIGGFRFLLRGGQEKAEVRNCYALFLLFGGWNAVLIVLFPAYLSVWLPCTAVVTSFMACRFIAFGKRRFLFPLVALLLTACGERRAVNPMVAVTIEPRRAGVEQLAGDHFEGVSMVPGGNSPETYDPTPSQLVKLSHCRTYFALRYIGFEQTWMARLRETVPAMEVVDLSEGLPLLESDHHHGNAHSDHHCDPHFWLSTACMKQMAERIAETLCQLDPNNTEEYRSRLSTLVAEIEATEGEIAALLAAPHAEAFLVYHPTLTYFAHDHRLQQIAIEEEGKEPSAAHLKELMDEAREAGVTVVFVQEAFDTRHARMIADALGARVVTINPLNPDWRTELVATARALKH